MLTTLKTIIAATTLVTGVAAAQMIYAHDDGNTPGANAPPTTQANMMGRGMTDGQDNMRGQDMIDDQGNMKGMLEQMHRMMQDHGKSMQTMMEDHSVKQPAKE